MPTALKNADNLLNEVLKAVDVNRDGKIQYNGMLWLDHIVTVSAIPLLNKLEHRILRVCATC